MVDPVLKKAKALLRVDNIGIASFISEGREAVMTRANDSFLAALDATNPIHADEYIDWAAGFELIIPYCKFN